MHTAARAGPCELTEFLSAGLLTEMVLKKKTSHSSPKIRNVQSLRPVSPRGRGWKRVNGPGCVLYLYIYFESFLLLEHSQKSKQLPPLRREFLDSACKDDTEN